jgi:hypothetical protein
MGFGPAEVEGVMVRSTHPITSGGGAVVSGRGCQGSPGPRMSCHIPLMTGGWP